MKKKCYICNKIFNAWTNNQKYCSDKCKKEGSKRYKAQWYKENHVPSKTEHKVVCAICNTKFIANQPHAKYCSKGCYSKAENQRRRNKYKNDIKYRQKILNGCQKYNQTHKKEKQEYYKIYQLKNSEKIKKAQREKYLSNQEYYKQKAREHRKNSSYREQHRQYLKKYLKIPQNRVANNLRGRVRKALKGIVKSASTMQLLGCSIEFLKQHLEKQFTKGMSWKNYGWGKNKWTIDHIRPCASFDLTKESEQRKCFNYKNLQPMWCFENSSKHTSMNWPRKNKK